MATKQNLRAPLLALGALVLSMAACHQLHQGQQAQQSQPASPHLAPGVTMQDVIFHSAALNRDMPYRVFLPAKLAPGQKLPVVYLLHGGGGSFREWSIYSDVAQYAAADRSPGLILVMPEGDNSFYMNSAENPQDRYEDYLLNDLIADVEARLPAAKGRENRALVGYSMGGFAAVKAALARPDLFVFVGALSPSVDILERHYALMINGMWPWIRSIFGPWGSKTRAASDPFLLVQTANPARTPYIYLSSGEQEALFDSNRRFASILRDRHFSCEFHTNPGHHDWDEWDSQIPGCFQSLYQHLPSANKASP